MIDGPGQYLLEDDSVIVVVRNGDTHYDAIPILVPTTKSLTQKTLQYLDAFFKEASKIFGEPPQMPNTPDSKEIDRSGKYSLKDGMTLLIERMSSGLYTVTEPSGLVYGDLPWKAIIDMYGIIDCHSPEAEKLVSVKEILQERGKTHGNFIYNSMVSQSMKIMFRDQPNWFGLSASQREALDMIAHKIGRILAGNPNFKDHWDDIAGYAQLIAKTL